MSGTHCCCLKNCKTYKTEGVGLFSVPNDSRRTKWIQFLNKNGLPFVNIQQNHRLCEHHFNDSDILRGGQRITLKKTAFPHYGVDEKMILSSLDDQESNFQENVQAAINICSNVSYDSDTNVSLTESLCSKLQDLNEYVQALELRLNEEEVLSRKWEEKFNESDKKLNDILLKLKGYFNSDQLDLILGHRKHVTWTDRSIEIGLQVKSRGQGFVNFLNSNKIAVLPSNRTLNRRIEGFKFSPGIQEFNLLVLKEAVKDLPPSKRRFGIVFDEKAITPGMVYDRSTDSFLGKSTLDPTANHLKNNPDSIATHILVFQLVGLETRFKTIASYEYTAGATEGKALKACVFEIIKKVEEITGVEIILLMCDLNNDNVSMMLECGVEINSTNQHFKFPHPFDSTREIYVKPDDVHNAKNLTCGLRNHRVKFSYEISQNLSSAHANFETITQVFNKQKNAVFKYDKNLKQKSIAPGHFDKMRENVATALFSPEVIEAIQILNHGDESNTTAFFLQSLQDYHRISTNQVGWSVNNPLEYENDINILKNLSENIFPNISFVHKGKDTNVFLRSLYGAITSMKTLINLSKFLFQTGSLTVTPSYFLTVSIENLFSLLVAKTKKPTALEAKQILRCLSISGYQKILSNGSYHIEDDTNNQSISFVKMITEAFNDKREENYIPQNVVVESIEIPSEINQSKLFSSKLELEAFHRDAPKLILKLSSKLACNICSPLLCSINDDTNNLELTPACRDILLKLEFCFRLFEKKIGVESLNFDENFKDNALALQFCSHCPHIFEHIVDEFCKYRRNLSFMSLKIPKPIKMASRSLV